MGTSSRDDQRVVGDNKDDGWCHGHLNLKQKQLGDIKKMLGHNGSIKQQGDAKDIDYY
jgi:hypothetical protein